MGFCGSYKRYTILLDFPPSNLSLANTCQIAFILMNFDVYRKVSNIRYTLVGNKIVDHSDVVGASPVGAAPTTSSFSI